jgi:cyclic dehypoxanthinyl futalosine synthase
MRESARVPIAVDKNDGLKAASAVFFYGTKLVTYFTNAGKFAKMDLLTAKRKNYSQIDYMSNIQPILDKAIAGERISAEDATILLESNDFVRLGLAAHEIRMRKNPTDVVTYIIDRNINYTNVCNVVCTFCAFYRRPGKPETYVHSIEEICSRIDETIELGGTGVLMQGGLHPDFNIEWYENLLSTLHQKYPKFQLHCFSPPEIHNIHLISGLDYVTIMQRLKDAGLNSMPGGGGEILDDAVRKRVSTKCNTQEWLDVMRAAHQVGLRTTASMMFGIGDKVEHRVNHLQRVRDVQDETGGFTAFIPWTFQRENTALGRKITEEPTGIDYLKMLSVSRIFLDNVDHIQSSWLTQGLRLGQAALRFGADDMGSIMIEENVVSAAGAHNEASEKELRYQISEAGFIPQQRDILYNYINRENIERLDERKSLPLQKLSVAFAD